MVLLIVGQPAGLMSSPMGREDGAGLATVLGAPLDMETETDADADAEACSLSEIIDQSVSKEFRGQIGTYNRRRKGEPWPATL